VPVAFTSMTGAGKPYVKWYEEDADGPQGPRRVSAAWIVRDHLDSLGERQEVMAYLGERPAITSILKEEMAALFPAVEFDWEAIAGALSSSGGGTNVASLTDDELALRLRDLARERSLSLMDLALSLGYRQRQILPEVVSLLENGGSVARFERTSGSIFEYLVEKHLEYAFLVYKARLFFEGDEKTLEEVVQREPRGFSDSDWRARRTFWNAQLDAYRARRSAPDV
jgi:hypothetical protein